MAIDFISCGPEVESWEPCGERKWNERKAEFHKVDTIHDLRALMRKKRSFLIPRILFTRREYSGPRGFQRNVTDRTCPPAPKRGWIKLLKTHKQINFCPWDKALSWKVSLLSPRLKTSASHGEGGRRVGCLFKCLLIKEGYYSTRHSAHGQNLAFIFSPLKDLVGILKMQQVSSWRTYFP